MKNLSDHHFRPNFYADSCAWGPEENAAAAAALGMQAYVSICVVRELGQRYDMIDTAQIAVRLARDAAHHAFKALPGLRAS